MKITARLLLSTTALMLAGAIPSMFDPITTNVPHSNAGKVRVLAISSEKRITM